MPLDGLLDVKLSAIRERVAVDAIKLAPKTMFSGIVGWGARCHLPRPLRVPLYEAFANAVGAELSEAEHSLSEYNSFGEFFARGLRAGVRPFPADPSLWIAPCDSVIAEVGELDGRSVAAKGRNFSLAALLSSERLALQLDGGNFATFYLAPRDYHRVHAPTDCQLVGYQYIPGSLFPVSPFYLQHIENLFAINERLVLELRSRRGSFALIMVGAAGVGNLRLSEPKLECRHLRAEGQKHSVQLETPIDIKRGQELGAFELGSTVILCAPPGMVELTTCIGSAIRFGEEIGRSLESPGQV